MMMLLKYGNYPEIGIYFGGLMKKYFNITPVSIVTYIPIYWTRMLYRGYNQSYYIAEGTTGRVVNLLQKTSSKCQKDATSTADRKIFSQGAYQLRKPPNGHVILVDDVIVTGSTVKEAANILIKGGAASVSVLSVIYQSPYGL